jgi:hypothetical protein
MAPTPPDTITIVVLPEYVPRHWWDRFLHNQKAHRIREALVRRPDTVVADVPYGGPSNANGGSGGSGGSGAQRPREPRRRSGWRR